MIHAQNEKWVNLTPPAAIVDNASLTIAELDCKGWDYAEIILITGATDIALTAAKLTESDTAGSGHADITGTRFGTDNNISGSASTLPSATDDNGIFKWELDLRKRKRFLDGVITVGDGTSGGFYVVVAKLSRGEISPNTAAEAGCSQIMRV
jgi:hypothetical protein